MADIKVSDLPGTSAPTSDDLLLIVDDLSGTPTSRSATTANTITKAHGLSDSTVVGIASGVMTSGVPVAIVDGGTGAVNASGARSSLGLAIGTDVVGVGQDITGKSAATDALKSLTTTVNVSSATAPTVGQTLIATNSTHATWQTPGTTGKLYYDTVVAPSGADYTTVGAAVGAGKTAIFVKAGTYAESSFAITAGTTIIGENRDTVILDFAGAGSITLADNAYLQGLSFQNGASAGAIIATSATQCQIIGNKFIATTGKPDNLLRLGGVLKSRIQGNLFINSTATASTRLLYDSSSFFSGTIIDNTFQGNFISAVAITQGSLFRFSRNYVQATYTGTTAGGLVDVNINDTLHDCSIENNYLGGDTAATNIRGVRIQLAHNLSVRDNNIALGTNTNNIGVDLIDADNILVDGNYVIAAATAYKTDASTDSTKFGINYSQATTYFTDGGTNTKRAILNGDESLLTHNNLSGLTSGDPHTQYLTKATMTTKGDVFVGNPSGVPARLGVGTDAFVLTADAASTNGIKWAAVASGSGQTLVTKVVAASGGDYTTLGAAITAASAGWTIYITPGSYSETTISTSLNNLTIIGAGAENTSLDFTTTNATFSGTNVNIQGIKIVQSNGKLTMSGASAAVFDCNFAKSGNNQALVMSGDISIVRGCRVISSATSNNSAVSFSGTNMRVLGNYFECVLAAGFDYIALNSTNVLFANNTVKWVSGGGTNTSLLVANSGADGSNIVANNFIGGAVNASAIRVSGGDRVAVTGNTIGSFSGAIKVDTSAFNTNIADNLINNTANTSTQMIIVQTSSTAAISGNTLRTDQAAVTGILYNGSSEGVISGNYIAGATPCIDSRVAYVSITGNFMSPATSGTGISLPSGADNNVVTGNTCDFGSTGISIAATQDTVIGNDFSGATTPISITAGTVGHKIVNNYGDDTVTEKVTVRMKNTSGATINAGNIVTLKAVAAGNEVTTTTTVGDPYVFGMAEANISNNATGSIAVKGKVTTMTVDGTTDIAVGDFISCFTTAGIGQKATVGTLLAVGDTAIAIALEAYASNDSNGVIDALVISPRKL